VDNLDEQGKTEPISDQTSELMEAALKCAGGDMGKARAMADGTYFDNVVIKGTYLLQDFGHSGIFIIFFNIEDDYIPFLDAVTIKSSIVYEQFDTSGSWKAIVREINTLKQAKDQVEAPSRLENVMREILSMDVFVNVKTGDIDHLEGFVEQLLRRVLGNQSISCKLNMEKISSLTMFQEGIPFEKPPVMDFMTEQIKSETVNHPELERQMLNVEKEADFIIEGSVILSPVKGKFLSDVTPGDKIMVALIGKDKVSRKVLASLKAVDDEGRMFPIPGSVVEKFTLASRGMTILYVLVAKGVMVKLIEEGDLKVAMIDTEEVVNVPPDSSKISISLVLFMLAITSVIIYFIIR
jgi:hypothetical protein